MTKIQKRPDFIYLLFLFAVGSIVGWCLEVVYRSIVSGCIIIPGFLLGPYCPIYGFGFVICKLIFRQERGLLSFAIMVALTSLLEYFASVLLESAFHVLLWDYSMLPFSIGTRVNLIFSIIWGLIGLLALKVEEPRLQKAFAAHVKPMRIFSYAALLVILADALISITIHLI